MNPRRKTLFAVLAALVLSACATPNPPYTFAEGEKKARLKLGAFDSVSMCKDGSWYALQRQPGQDGVEIPAGGRITVGRSMFWSEYRVHYSCYPTISFSPLENNVYAMDVDVIGRKCAALVALEDDSRRTGLSYEDSLRRGYCPAKAQPSPPSEPNQQAPQTL